MALVMPAATQVQAGEFAGSAWETAVRAPCPALAPHVLRIAGYDERAARPQSQRQFPETFVVLIVEFGPPLQVVLGGDARAAVRHAGGFVAALGDAFALCEHGGRQRGVQVDLTPTGARRLLGLPLSELAGYVAAFRDLFPAESRRLSDQLDATSDWARRLDLVEAFLERRILGSPVDTARVDHALARIHAAGGGLALGPLAEELNLSHKHLISLFHDQVGVTPKLLARLVRFQGVLRAARQGVPRPWAELAAGYGFSDQAHLAREVRHFTGLTPTQARAELAPELAALFWPGEGQRLTPGPG